MPHKQRPCTDPDIHPHHTGQTMHTEHRRSHNPSSLAYPEIQCTPSTQCTHFPIHHLAWKHSARILVELSLRPHLFSHISHRLLQYTAPNRFQCAPNQKRQSCLEILHRLHCMKCRTPDKMQPIFGMHFPHLSAQVQVLHIPFENRPHTSHPQSHMYLRFQFLLSQPVA